MLLVDEVFLLHLSYAFFRLVFENYELFQGVSDYLIKLSQVSLILGVAGFTLLFECYQLLLTVLDGSLPFLDLLCIVIDVLTHRFQSLLERFILILHVLDGHCVLLSSDNSL